MADERSFVAGYFALDLDGFKCGLIQKASGGDPEGDVTTLPLAHDYLVKKQIGNVKYNPIEIQCGLSMATPLKEWIEASLAMNYLRKSGEIKTANFKRQTKSIREFKDALLTKIVFPAGDATSKEAAFATLGFHPWITRDKPGDNSVVDNPADMQQKAYHPTDFKFNVDSLEKGSAKVSKVDALEIKQTAVSDQVGAERDYLLEPGKVEVPNVKITLSDAFADDYKAWFEQFVINGINEDKDHKTGTMVYLNRTRQKELLTLTFSGLGIYKLAAAPSVNNEDKIKAVTVEMYCEAIQAKFG